MTDETRQALTERLYERHKHVYDEAHYTKGAALGNIRILVDDIASGLPDEQRTEQHLAWMLDRMEIRGPIKRPASPVDGVVDALIHSIQVLHKDAVMTPTVDMSVRAQDYAAGEIAAYDAVLRLLYQARSTAGDEEKQT